MLDADAFVRFGFFLGAAFQIQDDLLNLVGNAKSYGKEIGGDIWEGKRTLMLIHLFEVTAAAERDRLGDIFGRPRGLRTRRDVQWVRKRMDHYGCVDYAREVAHGLAGAAAHEFELLYGGVPESRDKRFIRALATWVIERD
jgi:geranylgeranyl diphosphate synthase, type II